LPERILTKKLFIDLLSVTENLQKYLGIRNKFGNLGCLQIEDTMRELLSGQPLAGRGGSPLSFLDYFLMIAIYFFFRKI